jgi:hypothetical protein
MDTYIARMTSDGTLNEVVVDKVRQYRADYNNRPSNAISFMTAISRTSGRLHCEFVCLYFLLKSNVVHILPKVAVLRMNLNLDGTHAASRSHTHPSHSQTSRPLTSSLSSYCV